MFNHGRGPSASARVLALALVGGYLIYMAIKMISNVQTGASSMSMTTALTLAAVMGIAGAGVMGYGMYLGAAAAKKKEQEEEKEE